MTKALRIAALFGICVCISVLAQQTSVPESTTLIVDGIVYSNVIFRTVTPTTVSIYHQTGVATIPLGKLPPELQKRFGYTPEKAAAGEPATSGAPEARGVKIADYICAVADDFIVNVYRNGKILPDDKRRLILDVYGAMAERIEVPVYKGDWFVFNVANNRLRWNGVYYFAAAGMMGANPIVFQTKVGDRRWSYCDEVDRVSRFISDPQDRGTPVLSVSKPWDQGNDCMIKLTSPSWSGDPVWGRSRLTWIKFVAE